MFETGFLAGLVAKLATLGTATKAAICTATAAVTMTVAGAATGVIPIPGTGTGSSGTTPQTSMVVDPPMESVPAPESSVDTGGTASATTPAGSTSAGAGAEVNTPTPSVPTVPQVPVTPTLPDLPELPALPACVTNIVQTAVTSPTNPTAILSQVPGCIQSVIGSVQLPVNVQQCVAGVMQTASSLAGGNFSALSNLPQMIAGCLPDEMSIPFLNSIPGMGSVPGFNGFIPGFGGR